MLRKSLAVLVFSLSVIAMFPESVRAALPSVGQDVEVREGDGWTKVKVTAVEGRRLQVRYDDGTQEWIGQDRLRGSNTTAAPTDPDAKTDAAPGGTKKSAKGFSKGQAVEYKHFAEWLPAQVQDVGKFWIMISVADKHAGRNDREKMYWVPTWALRLPDSDYDFDKWGPMTVDAGMGDVEPDRRPDAAPKTRGDQFAVVPKDQRTPTNKELEEQYETASFENSHELEHSDITAVQIPSTQPSSEFSAWGIRGIEGEVDRLCLMPGNFKTVIAAFPGHIGKRSQVVRTNISSHSQLDTRVLPIPDARIIAANDDGDTLLSTVAFERAVQFWKWTDKQYKLVCNLQITRDGGGIRIASFVGPDKAVIGERNGSVSLVDLAKKQVLCTTKTARDGGDTNIFVHPSGKLVAFATEEGTILILRSEDFSIVAELPDANKTTNVGIDASGQFAAYITVAGSLRVCKIADNSQIGNIAVGNGFGGAIDLVNDSYVLIDHKTVYDVKTGIPLWLYKMPDSTIVQALPSGQFLIAANSNRLVSLAVATIPDEPGRNSRKNASPDKFLLKPGTRIKVDVDYNQFGETKDRAAELVSQILSAAALKESDQDEPFHLVFSFAGGPTEQREYGRGFGMMARYFAEANGSIEKVSCPSTILTCSLNYQGQALWSQEIRYIAGDTLRMNEKHPTAQEVANEEAKPTAEPLKSLAVPSYLQQGAKPGTPATLGTSTLQDRRFVPDALAIPPKAKKTTK